jgi:probable O-glycosylation ligase (exosortase A-associated)
MIDSRIPWWRETAASGPEIASASRTGFNVERNRNLGFSFWALMGFTFILLLAPQERFPVLAPMRIAMIAALLAIVAHLFRRISRGQSIITFSPPIKIVIALVAWSLITAPLSYWPTGSVMFLLESYAKVLIVFVLLANVIDTRARLVIFTWGLVLMSIPLAVTTIGNYMSGITIPTGDRVEGYSAGLTANPNDLALMLNIILPLCIALLSSSSRFAVRVLLISIVCLLTFAIITTFSRAGFLTLMVTGLCYFWIYRKRSGFVWLPIIVILGLLAFSITPSGYIERMSTILSIEDDPTRSAETRVNDMKVAAKIALANPVVGTGIGMNVIALNEARGETWTAVHNVYLQYLVELGLPGLTLFLLLYYYCLRATKTVTRALSANRSGGLFHIAEGLRVSLIAFAVAAMFHPAAYDFYFYCLAGLAIAAGAICSVEQPARAVLRVSHAGREKVLS